MVVKSNTAIPVKGSEFFHPMMLLMVKYLLLFSLKNSVLNVDLYLLLSA